MFPDRVHAQVLQNPEIEYESLKGRSQVEAVGPVALVEGAELEDKLAVQEWPPHAVDDTRGNCAESCVALDDIISQADGNVVQGWRVWGPQVWGVDGQIEGIAGGALFRCNNVAVSKDRELHRQRLVGGRKDSDIDFAAELAISALAGGLPGVFAYRRRPRQPQHPAA